MPTQGTATGATPVNIVSGLNLQRGDTYYLQNNGFGRIYLAEAVSTPATTSTAYLLLPPAERIEKTITREGLWVWSEGPSQLSATKIALAPGPLRDKFPIDVSSADYEDADGFILQSNHSADQAVTYVPFDSDTDRTETLPSGGFVQVANTPVLIHTVRMTGSPQNLVAGKL